MKKNFSASFVLSILFFILSISFCYAQGWELIGQKKTVRDKVAVEIEINDQNALYQELMFGVQIAVLKAKKVIATSVDGIAHEYEIDETSWIEPGQQTPAIILSDEGLALQKIKLIFYAKRSVIVEFYGKKALP